MLTNNFLSKKMVHLYIIILIIIAVFITVGIIILKYNVEGEKKLPFNLSKMTVISTAKDEITEDEAGILHANLLQTNNIYFHIEKNDSYKKKEIIKSVSYSNFKIDKINNKGEVKVYKPYTLNNEYKYTEDYVISDSLIYVGAQETNSELLEINNQGGVIGLSIVISNLGEYLPTINEKITSNGTLLNKTQVALEDLQMKVEFDLIIETESGNKFKSKILLDLPTGNILNEGVSTLNRNQEDFVFKRI